MKKIVFSDTLKNVSKISSGTAIGQVISMISLPILTRLYGATIIGNWALINSIVVIINSFSDLGLTNSIMTEKEKEKARETYSVIYTIVAIIGLIFYIGIFIYFSLIEKESWVKSLIVSLFAMILLITLQYIQLSYTWLNRNKEYGILMKNPIINNITVTISSIILFYLGFNEYGYYIGFLMGQILTLLHMKRKCPQNRLNLNFKAWKRVVDRNLNFVKYQTTTNIFMQFKGQLPTLLIKIFFGAEVLGYYSVAIRLINMPINFLANAMGRVFFQRASELNNNNENIGDFTLRNMKRAMKLAYFPIILCLVVGDIAFILFLGEQYRISGNIARIMIFYSYFLFLSMSVNGVAIIIEKQKYVLYSGILQIVGFFIGIFIGFITFKSIYIATFLMSIIFSIIQIIYFCSLYRSLNITISKYLIPLVKSLICIFICYVFIRGGMIYFSIVSTW